jgi:hypothetical protein
MLCRVPAPDKCESNTVPIDNIVDGLQHEHGDNEAQKDFPGFSSGPFAV